jgi:hypothetical protein
MTLGIRLVKQNIAQPEGQLRLPSVPSQVLNTATMPVGIFVAISEHHA